jgi:hypothetical protein
MHQLVHFVVHAESEDEAIETAINIASSEPFDGLYDYVKPMKSGYGMSGADRWTDYQGGPAAFDTTSDRGETEVEKAWDATYSELTDDLLDIHESMMEANSVEEMADNEWMRCSMYSCAPWTPGLSHHLFDVRGSCRAVSSPGRHEKLVGSLDGWVVPLDVHF